MEATGKRREYARQAMAKEVQSSMRDDLETIWNDYDVNNNNELEKAELQKLMKYFLDENCEHLVEEYSTVFTNSVRKQTKKNLEQSTLSPEQRKVLAEFVSQQIHEIVREAFAKHFADIVRDKEQVCEDITQCLDRNGDGIVSKEEFLSGFSEAIKETCHFDTILTSFAAAVKEPIKQVELMVQEYAENASERQQGEWNDSASNDPLGAVAVATAVAAV